MLDCLDVIQNGVVELVLALICFAVGAAICIVAPVLTLIRVTGEDDIPIWVTFVGWPVMTAYAALILYTLYGLVVCLL